MIQFRATLRALSARTAKFAPLIGVMALSAAGGAGAAPPPTPLGPVSSFEYFGFNFADNVATSSTVGTLDYSGQPGCGATCTATTSLGADPSASVTATEIEYQSTGGGAAYAELEYFVQYNNAPGSYDVTVDAHDLVSASGANNYAQAYLGLGQWGGSGYNVSFYMISSTDCTPSCRRGVGNYLTPAPIMPTTVSMLANTPYVVDLLVEIAPDFDSRVELAATLDPTFSTTAAGGTFTFSPGVTGPAGVPEPAAWTMMLSGAALLGGPLRNRRAMTRRVAA